MPDDAPTRHAHRSPNYPPDPLAPDGRADPRPTGELTLDARVDDGPDRYRFDTADGVHSPDAFRDAELLLLESLWDRSPDRLLVPEANYGVVGTVLAPRAEAVLMTESSARAAALCRRNADRNGVDAGVVIVPECTALDVPAGDAAADAVASADAIAPDRFDAAAYAPKPYTPVAVGKRRVANALAMLRPGGRLHLAASKHAGLARYEDCLRDLAADVERGPTRGGCRLLAATRPPALDAPTYVEPSTLRPTVDGVDLALRTVPGLFSPGELDAGTRLLLETAAVRDGERVLDVCCGYGAAGTWAALAADCEVHLADDDAVAAACARCSLRASGAEGTVGVDDCTTGVAGSFDRVLVNPPTHAGAAVLAALFRGVADVLAPAGELALVHHRDLDLRRHLALFDAVERRATGAEHVVLAARR